MLKLKVNLEDILIWTNAKESFWIGKVVKMYDEKIDIKQVYSTTYDDIKIFTLNLRLSIGVWKIISDSELKHYLKLATFK